MIFNCLSIFKCKLLKTISLSDIKNINSIYKTVTRIGFIISWIITQICFFCYFHHHQCRYKTYFLTLKKGTILTLVRKLSETDSKQLLGLSSAMATSVVNAEVLYSLSTVITIDSVSTLVMSVSFFVACELVHDKLPPIFCTK